MIYLTINGQEMSGILTAPLICKQVDFVQVKTLFDSSWDGLNKSYQFKLGGKITQLETNDEVFDLPYEATQEPATLTITVVGTLIDVNGNKVVKKATVNPLRFKVGCNEESSNPDNVGEVTPTVIEQLRQMIENAGGGSIITDTTMSDSSSNAVQNKVIKSYVDGLVGDVERLLAEV